MNNPSHKWHNKPTHEIAMYFIMKPHPHLDQIQCKSHGCDGGAESMFWLDIDKLGEYELYPHFFKTHLANLTDKVLRFVTRDGVTLLK